VAIEHAIEAVLANWDEMSTHFDKCDPFVLGCLKRRCHAVSAGDLLSGAIQDVLWRTR
jgi:hypothetical protein